MFFKAAVNTYILDNAVQWINGYNDIGYANKQRSEKGKLENT